MALLFLALLFSTNLHRIVSQEEDLPSSVAAGIDEANKKWISRMVHNVRWTFSDPRSKNLLGEVLVSVRGSQSHFGDILPTGLEDAKMAFLYGRDQPENMQIRFKTHPDTGAAYCEIGVVKDEVVASFLAAVENEETKRKACSYRDDGGQLKWTAFCPVDGLPLAEWQIANGTYNRPTKLPQCLYEFHQRASDTDEYNLFRYCAKGYFFNGKDYYDDNRLAMRKNWLLFLAQGRLTCRISGKLEADRALLTRGYKMELIHRLDRHRFYPEMELCPDMETVLTSYEDNDEEGGFFFAAVVGAGQLDGSMEWQYKQRPMDFWAEETFIDEYGGMNLDKRACYLLYHQLIRRNQPGPAEGRFNLELRITHFCNKRTMKETISFGLLIGAQNVLDGIYEDTGIRIDLSAGRLIRSTGQVLCAAGNSNANANVSGESTAETESAAACIVPEPLPPKPVDFGMKPLGAECTRDEQCDHSTARCTATTDTECAADSTEPTCRLATGKLMCGACACKEAWILDEPPAYCIWDSDCQVDRFCFEKECRRLRYQAREEPCKFDAECYPGFRCQEKKCQPAVNG